MSDAEIIEHLKSFRTICPLSAAPRALQIFLYQVPAMEHSGTPGTGPLKITKAREAADSPMITLDVL